MSRFYARVIEHADAINLGKFMRENIELKAQITTDEWTGYKPLESEFEKMTHIKSEKRERISQKYTV